MRNVLITGSDGFIGKNLKAHLLECQNINPIYFTKKNSIDELYKNILSCETIVHLAAVNRSKVKLDFLATNFKLTKLICDFIKKNQLTKNLIFFSSIHDEKKTNYGKTKKLGVDYLKKFSKKSNISVYILRLPRVFGKWSKPNYNSVIATFCEALQNNYSIKIYNPNKKLELSYIDYIIQYIIDYINLKKKKNFLIKDASNKYILTTNKVFQILKNIKLKNENSDISGLGINKNILKYLYSTLMSFLAKKHITKKLKTFKDKRGSFTEVLKTSEDGQFSFFTCEPGEIRGNHFHNTKIEKFLVVQGKAEFNMRNLYNEKVYKFILDGNTPELINSIPGFVHNIKNIGKEKLIVFVWANEIYNKKKPDTISVEV